VLLFYNSYKLILLPTSRLTTFNNGELKQTGQRGFLVLILFCVFN